METKQQNGEVNSWHVGREIPLALIITLFLQTTGLVWYFSAQQTRAEMRLSALEKNTDAAAWQAEKIIRIDEKLSTVQTSIAKIETSIHMRGERAMP